MQLFKLLAFIDAFNSATDRKGFISSLDNLFLLTVNVNIKAGD